MRKHLIWVLGLALAIGIANVAVGANNQTIDGTFKPNTNLSKTKFKGGNVNVITATGDADGDGVIAPAIKAQVFFDDDINFFTKGIPTCRPSQLTQTTTAQAKARCGKAQVGAGASIIKLAGQAGAPDTPAVVTAFNGTPKNGKPVILLHARAEAFGNTTVLVGVLNKLGRAGDFGWRLDVTIPELAFGSAIARFQVKVQKSYRFGGKARNYVSGRCGDGNRKLNYKGTFRFNGSPSKTATDAQSCTT